MKQQVNESINKLVIIGWCSKFLCKLSYYQYRSKPQMSSQTGKHASVWISHTEITGTNQKPHWAGNTSRERSELLSFSQSLLQT